MLKSGSSWVAAILNFLFWGAGYLYIRERTFLGIGLMLVFLGNASIIFMTPSVFFMRGSSVMLTWFAFLWFAFSVLFSVDVYMEVENKNKGFSD